MHKNSIETATIFGKSSIFVIPSVVEGSALVIEWNRSFVPQDDRNIDFAEAPIINLYLLPYIHPEEYIRASHSIIEPRLLRSLLLSQGYCIFPELFSPFPPSSAVRIPYAVQIHLSAFR